MLSKQRSQRFSAEDGTESNICITLAITDHSTGRSWTDGVENNLVVLLPHTRSNETAKEYGKDFER